MGLKEFVKELLIIFRIDLTQNIRYDRLTRKILKNTLTTSSNCIDIGCHKGEILDLMLRYAPHGSHFAFEPLPHLYANLAKRFNKRATIFPYALSNQDGQTTFQFVKNAPAYSGIKQRRYDIPNPVIEEIQVEMKRLDDLWPSTQQVHFIKIDVEGGEFGVLKGAKQLLAANKPMILFECGKGASDYYGTQPGDLFNFISEIGLRIHTLQGYIDQQSPLGIDAFVHYFNTNEEYYFVASRP